ncbi:MAG: sigma-54-dependent Fis family transcriptional regulator [Candidatus Hydrogenedentota bacterium]|nr:MAG: sigma-54-dependent Fis family transcriptional regulator [Candidatus Hydrogenedentota bacterium]
MPEATILVVDDEKNTREALSKILHEDGYDVLAAADGYQAMDIVGRELPDLILADLKMPGMDGIELLSRTRLKGFDVPFVMMTAYGTVETAVEAMRKGAADYLTKPVNIEELEIQIRRILDHRRLLLETKELREQLRDKYKFKNIIGSSPQMQSIFKTVAQVAPSRATVLITGESGTGKELIASAIHQNGPRADKPYVKVSCSALSENLLESELFGHEKGAFTGALSTRQGRFEIAEGGTLFLDEIGEISPSTQVKLLGFLQDRKFERVGGNKTFEVDVRLIAATNKDLEKCIAEGTFRQDLFYRLNVITIKVPPLREKSSDVPLLVEHFAEKYAKENQKQIEGVSPDALAALIAYDWPGNVRELENVVERAVVMCNERTIGRHYFPVVTGTEEREAQGIPPIPGSSLEEIEKYAIKKTLEAVGGNRTRAAEILRVSLRKIQYKLKEF